MNLRLPMLWKHLPTAALVAVGILPIIILILWFDVPRKIIGKGALAYAVGAVAMKLPLYHLLVTKILHMIAGQKELAITNYQKSLKLNPANANALEMLQRLQAK